jgi:hypothetical protein
MPTPTNTYADKVLTRHSVKYANELTDFIADKVFPIIPVKERTGIYFEYGKESLRIPRTLNTGATRAARVQYEISQQTYGPLKKHALEIYIDEDELDMAETPLEPRRDATEVVTEMLMLQREKALADAVFSTSIITQNVTLSGSDQWSDYDNSDPFDDFKTGIESVKENGMKLANTIVMGWQVWNTLRFHPALLDRAPITGLKVLSKEQLATILEVPNILVGGAMYDTAQEGQTASLGFIWGKKVLLAYIEQSPKKKSLTLGYTLQKTNGTGGIEIERFEENGVDGEFVKAKTYYEQKVIAAPAGYLMDTVIA